MTREKGSQRAMLKLIESENFITIISNMVKPHALITVYDNWMPKSLHNDKEAELKDFLSYNFSIELGENIHNWWLDVKHPKASTPNWDLVSTCTIKGKKGLLLIEAKAHVNELHVEGKSIDSNASPDSVKNHESIKKAIEDANVAIKKKFPEISISRDKCYQLSNRIAYSWWLANQGIPVVLMYLGFLNCLDMNDGKRKLFKDDKDWFNCFMEHAQKVGADKLIDERVDCGKSEFITICRSY